MYFVLSRTSSVKINSSLSPPYFNIHGVTQYSVLVPILFIIYSITIKSIVHKYPNINYHLYADDRHIDRNQNRNPFHRYRDSGLIQMVMFNCITDLTHWLSHKSISLNITNTDTIIFSRPSAPLSITHPNMIRTANYFLYNIRKSRYKLTFATKYLIHSLVFSRHIYCCSLLNNLSVNLMYKLESIKYRAIRVLYKLL